MAETLEELRLGATLELLRVYAGTLEKLCKLAAVSFADHGYPGLGVAITASVEAAKGDHEHHVELMENQLAVACLSGPTPNCRPDVTGEEA